MSNDLVSVFDYQLHLWHAMNQKRATELIEKYPERFSYVISNHIQIGVKIMKKKVAPSKKGNNSELFDPKPAMKLGRVKIQNFADLQGEASHVRFDEMIDETIYLIGLEPMASESYGDGYKVHFKDLPTARDTRTAACFGQYVVPVLDSLYHATNEGETITELSPVKTTIRNAGKTYKFE